MIFSKSIIASIITWPAVCIFTPPSVFARCVGLLQSRTPKTPTTATSTSLHTNARVYLPQDVYFYPRKPVQCTNILGRHHVLSRQFKQMYWFPFIEQMDIANKRYSYLISKSILLWAEQVNIGPLIRELLHGNEISNCGEQVAAVLAMNLVGTQWQ